MKTDCIFAETKGKTENGCIILVCACEPETCVWYKNEQTMLASLAKASAAHAKGTEDYINKFCPPIYRDKLRSYINASAKPV